MKKTFLAITALAAMLFAGCTSSDELTTLESIKTADNTPTPVQFGTYMGRTGTRAGATGNIVDRSKDGNKLGNTNYEFGVFGYMKGTNGATDCYMKPSTDWVWQLENPNFMYNQKVDWNTTVSGAWGYSPLKYWPNDFSTSSVDAASPAATGSVTSGKLSFFAYAPYVDATASSGTVSPNTEGITALSANNVNTEPWVTYKFAKSGEPAKYNLTTSANVDLLWGTRTTASYNLAVGTDSKSGYVDSNGNYYNTDLTKQKTDETVDFSFKHALAKFGGREGDRCGLQVVADFDLNDASPAETPSGTTPNVKPAQTLITLNSITIENMTDEGNKFAIGGKFNLARGTWSEWEYATASELSTQYTVASTGANADVWEPASPVLTYADATWKNSSTALPGISEVYKDVFSSAADALYFIPGGNCKMKITVQYTVRTYDPNLVDLDGETTAETTSTKVVQTIANVVDFASLKSNHFYKLIIHLGLTSIKFSAAVSDWDTTTNAVEDTQVIWLPSNTVPAP